MNKKLRAITFALVACLILTTASPLLPTVEGSSSVVKAASRKNKLTVTKKGEYVFLQIGKTSKATGFYKIPSKLKSADGKVLVNKGIYYLNKGKISNYPQGKVFKTLKMVSKKGKIISKKKYMLKVKNPRFTLKKGISRVSSSTKLFTGSYQGVKYKNGKAKTKKAKKNTTKKTKKTAKASTAKASLSAANVKSNKAQVVNRIYYKNKRMQSQYTGWLKLGKKLYYIRRGKAFKGGYHALNGYKCSSRRFKYLFNNDGSVVSNAFGMSKRHYNALLKAKLKFEINLSSHTFTIYMKDNETGYYTIPLKSFVFCSSRQYNGTPTGNYTLNKSRRHRWFIYKRSNPYHYYQWSVKIGTTDVIIHSNMYYSANNRRLVKKYYNKFGKNITTHCVRVQAVNAKMIYQIAQRNKNKIKVKIYRNKSNPGPFGKITLNDTTGKTKKNYDPTDPNIVKNAYKLY